MRTPSESTRSGAQLLVAAIVIVGAIHGRAMMAKADSRSTESPEMGAGIVAAENAVATPEITADQHAPAPCAYLEAHPIASREGDKGSSYTDAATGAATTSNGASPNAIELAKLELARRAVQAAEAAGTRDLLPENGGSAPPVAIEMPTGGEAAKLELLRSLLPDAQSDVPGVPAEEDAR